MSAGMNMMVRNLMAAMGLDPEKIASEVANFGQIMAKWQGQMDRIEANQADLFRIVTEQDHERRNAIASAALARIDAGKPGDNGTPVAIPAPNANGSGARN